MRLFSLLPTLALAVDPRFPAVQLWACGTPRTQAWALNTTGAAPGFARILLKSATPKLLQWDIDGPRNATGTDVHLVFPLHTTSQEWRFNSSHGTIESLFAPGQCAAATSALSGSPLLLAPCKFAGAGGAFTFDSSSGVFALRADATLCIDSGSFANCSTLPNSEMPYCNPALAPASRAADLASRLMPSEAASFLSNENVGLPRFGIPRVGYGEALHGYLRNCVDTPVEGSTGCPTSFPHLHLLGGSFNRTLWQSVALAIADEGRAYFNLVNRTSHLITWAPDINPFRDPRCECAVGH